MISFMCKHDLQLVGTLNQYKFNKGSSSLFNFPGELYHLTALQAHPCHLANQNDNSVAIYNFFVTKVEKTWGPDFLECDTCTSLWY